jgi:hypothetical protein
LIEGSRNGSQSKVNNAIMSKDNSSQKKLGYQVKDLDQDSDNNSTTRLRLGGPIIHTSNNNIWNSIFKQDSRNVSAPMLPEIKSNLL